MKSLKKLIVSCNSVKQPKFGEMNLKIFPSFAHAKIKKGRFGTLLKTKKNFVSKCNSYFSDKKISLNVRKKYIQEVRKIILNKILNFETSSNYESRILTYKKMLKKSMQYGHKFVKCHPGMKKFVRDQFNGKHFINLVKTRRYLIRALWFLTKYAYKKKSVLFVGTTVPTSRFVATAAVKTKSFFINVRWLGGMLTNWRTIEKLLKKLRDLPTKLAQKTKTSNSLLPTREKQTSSSENLKVASPSLSSMKSGLPKKEIAMYKKEKQRLEKYLKGIKKLTRLPQVVILATQMNDISAAYECKKLGISNITIVDTDCNPSLADFIIPANDDSASSMKFVLYYLSNAIRTGTALYSMRTRFKKKIENKKKNTVS